MEKNNIPTVVIVTEPFISSSMAMAVAQGIPDYPFAAIPHPIAATENDVLTAWAENVLPRIEIILLEGK